MTPKQRIIAALHGQPRDRVPVAPIFMAWAAHHIGRTYRDYYLDAEVLAQSQIAVMRLFEFDQVSAISDPWREAEAFGMKLDYPPQGVGIPRGVRLQSRDDVASLTVPDIGAAARLSDRVAGVRRMAEQVGKTHSVLGWIEGPIAEYVDLRGMEESLLDLVDSPRTFYDAAEVLVETGIRFARAQIEAGADMIGIGDAAASLIGPDLYRDLVLPWQRRLIDGVHAAGATVRLHTCGNIAGILPDMASTGADIIDVDWMVPLDSARRAVGPDVTLCGNFNPAGDLLRGTPEDVARAARDCIRLAGDRFILQPGCEIPPGTPVANIAAFCPGPGCLITDALKK